MASWKSPQFFAEVTGSVGDPAVVDPATFVPSTAPQPLGFPQRYGGGGTGCERLWRVRSSGREVLRFSAEALTPLSREQVEQPDRLPAGASGAPVTRFKKLIKLQSRALTLPLVLDIGQAIELYGFSVDVDILGPLGTVEVSSSVPATMLVERGPGLVADAVLAVEILAIEAPLGNREARLTQHVFVAANTQSSIPIPYAAVGLRILQTAAGAASTFWTRLIGDPAIHPSLEVGQVTFTNRISDVRASEIGDATTLRTDVDAVNDRFYTLIWRIRP